MIEKRKRCDAKIDGLRNKAGQSGNIIRRHERCANPNDDDDFDGMSDENFDGVSLGHGDQFGKPRNHRYGGAMRDRQFSKGDDLDNFGYHDGVDRIQVVLR